MQASKIIVNHYRQFKNTTRAFVGEAVLEASKAGADSAAIVRIQCNAMTTKPRTGEYSKSLNAAEEAALGSINDSATSQRQARRKRVNRLGMGRRMAFGGKTSRGAHARRPAARAKEGRPTGRNATLDESNRAAGQIPGGGHTVLPTLTDSEDSDAPLIHMLQRARARAASGGVAKGKGRLGKGSAGSARRGMKRDRKAKAGSSTGESDSSSSSSSSSFESDLTDSDTELVQKMTKAEVRSAMLQKIAPGKYTCIKRQQICLSDVSGDSDRRPMLYFVSNDAGVEGKWMTQLALQRKYGVGQHALMMDSLSNRKTGRARHSLKSPGDLPCSVCGVGRAGPGASTSSSTSSSSAARASTRGSSGGGSSAARARSAGRRSCDMHLPVAQALAASAANAADRATARASSAGSSGGGSSAIIAVPAIVASGIAGTSLAHAAVTSGLAAARRRQGLRNSTSRVARQAVQVAAAPGFAAGIAAGAGAGPAFPCARGVLAAATKRVRARAKKTPLFARDMWVDLPPDPNATPDTSDDDPDEFPSVFG